MRDVAEIAAVSVMTVSNVINGRFDLMSGETRKRVDDAIERLNYRRDASARSLRLSQRFSIGMVVVDPSPAFLADPFTTYLVAGLSNGLGQHGYNLVLRGLDAASLETASLIRNQEVDALCAFLSGPPRRRAACLDRLTASGQPVLLLQEKVDIKGRDMCLVRQDDFGGGRQLAARLVARGARRLTMLVPALDWPAIAERRRGIRAALGGASLSILQCADGGFDAVAAALRGLPEWPDAIVAGNDQMGMAALSALAERGVRVPEDVLVTGFNGFEFWRYSNPRLTTIRSPAYELGLTAAQEVLARLQSGRWRSADIVLPVTLEPGASS